MSYFDDASLVMIPSGYKTSKVYSIKPTDGSGDLAFSRSNDTATRVGPDGLIEKVRTNLALYSQDWTNWTLFQATATANTTANPLNGAVDADTLTISTATTGVSYRSVSTGTALATFSVYLKAGTHDQASVGFTDGTDFAVNVDLTLGTITGVSSGVTGTITSVGSGWYRVTATRTISNTSTPNAFVNVIVGTVGDSVIVFGAQVELGDIATDYIATTSAAVSVGPVSGLPRLDYLNSTCPRLLLEPQRTNVATYSEQFDNAAWSKTKATVTANDTISPDGYTNADKIVFADGTSTIYQTYNLAGATATRSVYIKGTAGQTISLDDVFASQPLITLTGQWQRITFTAAAPNGYGFGISTFGGATARTIWLWGAQTEVGSYATSYIPTLGAAVTRGADAASKTGISSLIGQTEGTLFAEVDLALNGNSAGILAITGVGTTFIYLFTAANTNVLNANVYVSGVQEANMTYTLPSAGTYKIAIGYKANDFVLYVNGVQRGSDNSGSVPACSDLYIDSTTYNILPNTKHSQALLFKTRLSNADLAALTA